MSTSKISTRSRVHEQSLLQAKSNLFQILGPSNAVQSPHSHLTSLVRSHTQVECPFIKAGDPPPKVGKTQPALKLLRTQDKLRILDQGFVSSPLTKAFPHLC